MKPTDKSLVRTRFTDTDHRRYKAAAQRYGPTTGARVIAEYDGADPPSHDALRLWLLDERIVPTEEDAQFWLDVEANRTAMLKAELSRRVPDVLGAVDRILAEQDPKELQASKVQNLAISMGIFFDKIAGIPFRNGVSIEASGGNIAVQINTYQPRAALPQPQGEIIDSEVV